MGYFLPPPHTNLSEVTGICDAIATRDYNHLTTCPLQLAVPPVKGVYILTPLILILIIWLVLASGMWVDMTYTVSKWRCWLSLLFLPCSPFLCYENSMSQILKKTRVAGEKLPSIHGWWAIWLRNIPLLFFHCDLGIMTASLQIKADEYTCWLLIIMFWLQLPVG